MSAAVYPDARLYSVYWVKFVSVKPSHRLLLLNYGLLSRSHSPIRPWLLSHIPTTHTGLGIFRSVLSSAILSVFDTRTHRLYTVIHRIPSRATADAGNYVSVKYVAIIIYCLHSTPQIVHYAEHPFQIPDQSKIEMRVLKHRTGLTIRRTGVTAWSGTMWRVDAANRRRSKILYGFSGFLKKNSTKELHIN